MKYKFNVGDSVKIVSYGFGLPRCEIGKVVTITEIGSYVDSPGYKISPPLGNTLSGGYNGFIGECSFKIIEKITNWKKRMEDKNV